MKEGKEPAASPKHRHEDLKGFYNSFSSAAASELVFFPPLIRRENGDNTLMINRNKSERDILGCFSATAKNTLVIVSGCRKADLSRYLFSLLLVI